MSYIVGLTGGIASGKTVVANLFHDHFGIDIVDADMMARKVVEPGTRGLIAVAAHFGDDILTDEGELDRKKLRERIFSHPEEKKWLNHCLHPLINEAMKEALAKTTTPYTLLVVPLLVENKLQTMTNRVLVVDVEPEIQIQRTMKRDNVPRSQAESILASQASREARLEIADDIILNNNQGESLLLQVTQLHKKYMNLCC